MNFCDLVSIHFDLHGLICKGNLIAHFSVDEVITFLSGFFWF